MSVQLKMSPETPPLSWDAFCESAPPFAIALDGYVAEGPRYSEDGPHLNLNHHENVDRLATRATCGQVLLCIRQGLFDRFSEDGNPHATVFANDCDEDVCTSFWLLSNSALALPVMNPSINRLVHMVEVLDTTAGAYPFPADLTSIQELEWVFQPYRAFRSSGGLDSRDAERFSGIVTDVGNRIMRFAVGSAETVALDTRYNVLHTAAGWTMLEEVGLQGRIGAFRDGVRAYVIARRREEDDRWAYTVGRISPFIPFDVLKVLAALDAAEGNSAEHWGGGNTIGGSPRSSGSCLPPDEVVKIVNSQVAGGGA